MLIYVLLRLSRLYRSTWRLFNETEGLSDRLILLLDGFISEGLEEIEFISECLITHSTILLLLKSSISCTWIREKVHRGDSLTWFLFFSLLVIMLLNGWSLLFREWLGIMTKCQSLVMLLIIEVNYACSSNIRCLLFVLHHIDSTRCVLHGRCSKHSCCCESLLRQPALRTCWPFLSSGSWSRPLKSERIAWSCTTSTFLSLSCSSFKEETL